MGRAALLIAGNCACGPHLRCLVRLPWDDAHASRARLDSAGRAASLVAGACAATAAAALVRGRLRPCHGPCITGEEACLPVLPPQEPRQGAAATGHHLCLAQPLRPSSEKPARHPAGEREEVKWI